MLKGFSVFLCVCVCVCVCVWESEREREREREREDICVCACVCVCVSDLCVCSHCTLERHRVRNVRERGYIPRSNPNLWLDAFCLYLPNPPATHWHTHRHTHTHTQAHAHTHTPMSPSIHLPDMIVPLLLLYVLIHQLWVKRQLHPAIDAASRQSQNYGTVHYCKLLLKSLFFFFCSEAWGASGE